MPCVFCKSSEHKLKDCDSQIAQNFLMDVIEYHTMNSFNLEGQITFLMRYTNPQLAVICAQLKTNRSVRKDELICYIIRYLFDRRTSIDMLPTLTPDNLNDIDLAYIKSFMPHINPLRLKIRSKIMTMLNDFYERAYGIGRYGLELHHYYDMVREYRANRNGFHINNFLERVRLASANPNQNGHLKKLDLCVEINASLEIQDCSICCEDKPNARLGCSHEYCVDCVFGSAKARNKSFITCAMCRAEIQSVQVETEELKAELLQKISTV